MTIDGVDGGGGGSGRAAGALGRARPRRGAAPGLLAAELVSESGGRCGPSRRGARVGPPRGPQLWALGSCGAKLTHALESSWQLRRAACARFF